MKKDNFSRKLRKLNKGSLKLLLENVGISEMYSQLLNAYYVEEKSIMKIAEQFGYTKESIYGLLMKARKCLKFTVETQYELYDYKIRRIIDFLDEI